MITKDHYELLDIKNDATQAEIDAAYAKVIAHDHYTPEQVEAFRLAYQTLTDPEKRKAYDDELPGPFDPGESFPYEDLDSITETKKPKTLKARIWSITQLSLKIVITCALLYYVFSKLKLEAVKALITQSNPWWMLAAVVCFFISTFVASSRLLSFFKSIDLHIDWKFNMRLYMLGMFYNLCLPGGIGGDGYKIYLLNKRYKKPAKKVFWAIFFDRLSGFWAIGFITAVLVIFLPQLEVLHITPLITWAALIAGTAIYYFVAYKFFNDYTKHFWEAHIKAIAVQGLQVLTILLVMISLHHDGKFAPYLSAFLASSMAAVIPFSVGGLGFREFIFKYVIAEMFHMNGELAVVLSLSFYVVSALVSLLGVYYVFRADKLEEE